MKKHYAILSLIFFGIFTTNSQTVGLIQHDPESLDQGYILFAPLTSTTTYLIDKCGRQVKTWNSNYIPGSSVYLLPDGTLLRAGNTTSAIFTAGGSGGIVEKIDWEGNVIWSYAVSDATKCQHHDIRAMPNGNVLIIAWDSRPQAEAIAAGRNPELTPENLWSEMILEVEPVGATGGNIVWEWHLWDHLVQDFDETKSNFGNVADNPQLVNINYGASIFSDWIHLNSIDYNPALDQIVLSSFPFGEIWIIDHSTTTAEAASHSGGNSGKGGDLLYRYGNPQTYNHPIDGSTLFNGQHNAHWIDSGLPFANQLMIHNNGNGRIGGNYSTVEIIETPVNGFNYDATLPFLPSTPSWTYNAGNVHNYYAPFVSGAQQLPNGNVLICDGPAGVFFEVTASGETVWKYNNPVNNLGVLAQGDTPSNTMTFRCKYYPFEYSGFAGHNLVAGNTIENINPLSAACSLNLSLEEALAENPVVHPNPAKDILNISLPAQFGSAKIVLANSLGQTVYSAKVEGNVYSFNVDSFNSGLYYLKITTDRDRQFIKKIVIN